MKYRLLAALIGLLAFSTMYSSRGLPNYLLKDGKFTAYYPGDVRASDLCGYVPAIVRSSETLTVSSSVKILTRTKYIPTDPPNAIEALIGVNTNSIRLTADASTPTSSVGLLLSAGQTIIACAANLQTINMIRVTSDADVYVTYSFPAN